MLLSTPGLVLHTTPYGEASVVAKVFTRQLGVRSYLVKGVRGPRGKVKQNLLQPLSCVDMVVYENPKTDLNYIKEISPRNLSTYPPVDLSVENALRFFMTEVLYKALRAEEPMPDLFDYVESVIGGQGSVVGDAIQLSTPNTQHLPIVFLLVVARHLGIEPLDNIAPHEPYFDLQEGRFVAAPTETTLPVSLSLMLHDYLSTSQPLNPSTSQPINVSTCQRINLSTSQPINVSTYQLPDRRLLIDALIAYYQLHLSGFHHFYSHEILHTILK